ncbi:MAG: NAD-dependent epimerase/dehydratase family protein [Cyclobacteriaceae bacterium]
MDKILVTGAGGQLGIELTKALGKLYGGEAIWATDITNDTLSKFDYCNFAVLDVLDKNAIHHLIKKEGITQIYHLAAILSAKGEKDPHYAWNLNVNSLLNILELSKSLHLDKVFWPSSIAVFGPNTPKINTPQYSVKEPNTVYGISKLAGERWCEYYHLHGQVDVRSLRYPGLIGYKSQPGGGTTDYAVDIFHKALKGESFKCFLKKDTTLPMMYMPDAVNATLQLMQAPIAAIHIRSSYNLAAISFSPEEIYRYLLDFYPDFKISYEPDFRQRIAEGWPLTIDDQAARNDWGWLPKFDLPKMVKDILINLPNYIHQNLK